MRRYLTEVVAQGKLELIDDALTGLCRMGADVTIRPA